MALIPRPEWSRGFGAYVAAHPTNYSWRSDIRAMLDRYLSADRLGRRVSVNTYRDHPPGWHRDTTSVDFWGPDGRGDPLGTTLRKEVFRLVFNDPKPPNIAWIISGGGMWTPGGGWQDAPWGPAGSDAGHWNHVHVTYQ